MTSPSPDPAASPARNVRDLMVRSRVLAVAVLFCVALAGGLSAIALDRFVIRDGRHGPGGFGGGEAWRERGPLGRGGFEHGFRSRDFGGRGLPTRERFGRELGLSREQQTRIDSLMERQLRELRAVRQRVQPEVDSIVAQTRREIDAILTPEQRAKAQALMPPLGGSAGPGPGAGPGAPDRAPSPGEPAMPPPSGGH